jgi:DNA-binding NarL/FixJ family response regulator
MNPLQILLADPHTLFRAGLRSLLESLRDLRVVAEAGDGQEALLLIEEHRPDVALIALGLPGLNGAEVITRARRSWPDVKALVMSMQHDEDQVRKALQAGSAGYLLKDSGFAELELAVRAVARGEAYLSPAVARYVIGEFVRAVSESTSRPDLTARQREILQLTAEGCTTKETARRLGLTVKTVENHRAEIMKRLDIHDVAGLVRYAVRTGMVPSE